MDFLDSIDVEQTHKKSHRVRSWYLYEQYKSLEKNQADAAQKLKDKSLQDKLLHRELSERRARLKICSQSELHSVTGAGIDDKSCVTSSDNDFFESFCEVQDDQLERDFNSVVEPTQLDQSTEDKEAHNHQCSKNPSLNSIVENVKSNRSFSYHASVSSSNLADEIKEELEFVKKSIAENIDLQLETVEENLHCLEECTRLREDSSNEKSSRDDQSSKYGEDYDDESTCSTEYVQEHDDDYSNVYAIWTKLVTFAYQVVRLNHGNCYYDYSSQFLTAVLACDVLRRGVNKMCKLSETPRSVLDLYSNQRRCIDPYISPIKFNDSPNRSIQTQKQIKRKFSSVMKKKTKKSFGSKKYHRNFGRGVKKSNMKSLSATFCGDRNYESKNWRILGLNKIGKKHRIASEPWQNMSALKASEKHTSSSTIWPNEFNSKCSEEYCSCNTRVANPMLKLASYIDSVLTNIGDSSL